MFRQHVLLIGDLHTLGSGLGYCQLRRSDVAATTACVRPLPTTQYSVVVRASLLMDAPLAGAAPKAPPFPPAPPLPPLKFVHPLMLNALSTAKGAVLGGLVTNGYLKECQFTLGKNYSKEGNWKLECRLCRKEIVTGDGRTQNVLMHLARQHVDSIDATVLTRGSCQNVCNAREGGKTNAGHSSACV